MPCGCQNACGCVILGDGVTTTAVTVGDTTTVSAVQTFLGVLSTPCIALSVAAGIVSAALVLDPTTQSIVFSCGATGLIANLKIDGTATAVIHSVSNAGLSSILRLDPASSAPVSQSAAGLKVDCCPAGPPAISDTATVDLSIPLGILNAVVIPNTTAGIENQALGVSIKLEGDPAAIVPLAAANIARFTTAGDLTVHRNDAAGAAGIDVRVVSDGSAVFLSAGAVGAFGGTSLTLLVTNTDVVPLYVNLQGIGIIQASALAPNPDQIGVNMLLEISGGTGLSIGGRAEHAITDDAQLAAGFLMHWRGDLSKWALLDPGKNVTFVARTQVLQPIINYTTGVPGPSFFQFINPTLAAYPVRTGGWSV